MKLLDYLYSIPIEQRNDFAARVGHSFDYLRQIGYGNRTCGESTAIALDRESGGIVSLTELRPDVDWAHVAERLAA